MAHLYIHAGLHKTGSTSLQHMLKANQNALPPGMVFVPRGLPKFGALAAACRSFDPQDRGASKVAITGAMQTLLHELVPQPDARLLLTSENFAGPMPSTRQARPLYGTAPAIARALLEGAEGHQVTFVYYSRDRAAWLQSWHKHQLAWRAAPLGWEELLLRPNVIGFDPAAVAGQVRATLPVEVISLTLEDDLETPLGPGAGFLRVAELSDDDLARMRPVRPYQQTPRDWVFGVLRSKAFNALPAGPRRRLKTSVVRLDRLRPRR